MPENQGQTNIPEGGQALKQFQLTTASIKEKSSKEYGLSISRYIASTTSFNTGGFYFTRNARYIKNRNYANGTMDIQAMFRDRFQFNGKQNYIALNWNALQIVNRIISGLVGRWMKKNERISVSAVDDLSQTQKEDEYKELEAYIFNKKRLQQFEQESGIQALPQKDLPEDEDELQLWQAQYQRIPEEILTELGANNVLESNGFFEIQKEKALHDAAETLFVGTYTWMDTAGVIHVRLVKPENAIYSFSEQNDLRDTSWRGEAPTVKISEIRRQWGKEFNPDNPFALTEKEIFAQVVPKCKEYQYQTNIGWNDLYYNAILRPYDEWNTISLQFELKTVDSEPYTVTKTKNNSTYTQKGMPVTKSGNQKEKPSVHQNIIGDTNWNIYRGVYLPECNILLEWGLKDNMIRPQDPNEIGNAEFSYSYFIPQNYMMNNMAIPQKIEAAVDGMILACLKIQQDVANAIPPGWIVDETALQNIDYGLGEAGNKAVDQSKLFFQTGKLYYKGLDAEGNRVPVPIQEIANSGFAAHVAAFIQTYEFWYKTLKDELGEDPNLITAAVQPRVTEGNVEASQLQSEYATDYVYNAYKNCMEITARKISCLLKDSVQYGSKAYRDILKKEDVYNRVFTTKIKMLPTDYDLQRFEALMNKAMDTTPELSLFIDPMRLIRIAKEDVKLAEALFRNATKKMILWKQQTAQENQKQTIQGQIASAQEAEKSKQETESIKGNIDIEKTKLQNEGAGKNAVLTMVTSLLSKGEPIPANLMPLVNATIESMIIPMVAETEEQKMTIMQQMQQAQQPQQEMPDQSQQQIQQPPPDQMAA